MKLVIPLRATAGIHKPAAKRLVSAHKDLLFFLAFSSAGSSMQKFLSAVFEEKKKKAKQTPSFTKKNLIHSKNWNNWNIKLLK